MSPVQLTDSDFRQILNSRFGRIPAKCVKATFEPLSDDVEGYMGEHYKLRIDYELNGEQRDEYFFVKTKSSKNRVQRQLAEELKMYDMEIFLYSGLFREFEKYGLDVSFSPKCFHSVPGETIVMEDLARQGFVLSERGKVFTVEQCKCVLRSLALLHAAGIMYEEIKSKELGRRFALDEEFADQYQERYYTHFCEVRVKCSEEWMSVTLEVFCKLIDYLPENEDYKADFKKRLLAKEIGKIFAEKTNIKKTCSHGDLWSNNILCKMENGIPVRASLVDYQIARYFYPAYDVLLFFHSNVDAAFRRKHMKDLCQFYYQTLSDILAERGYKISDYYSVEDYERSLRMVEFETKLQAYTVHSVVLLPTDFLNKAVNDVNDEAFENLLFNGRVSIVAKAFKNNDNYRRIMTEDLYELHDCLF